MFSHYIFDLDGTLSDPLVGMANALNHALVSHGFPEQHSDNLAQFVGPPLETSLVTLTGRDDSDFIMSLVGSYREKYLATGYRENSLYPGITDTLTQLRDTGARLGVCTSKPEKTARLVLQLFELEGFFEFVSGGDVGVTKAQQLAELLSRGTIDQHALMIGDREVDVSAARSCELHSAAVAWGYGSTQELTAAEPSFHVNEPLEICRLMPSSTVARAGV